MTSESLHVAEELLERLRQLRGRNTQEVRSMRR
jgi:hypothetical protein